MTMHENIIQYADIQQKSNVMEYRIFRLQSLSKLVILKPNRLNIKIEVMTTVYIGTLYIDTCLVSFPLLAVCYCIATYTNINLCPDTAESEMLDNIGKTWVPSWP